MRQAIKNGSTSLKRRKDKKIFNLKYDIFHGKQILISSRNEEEIIFKTVTDAAKYFHLKLPALQYALSTGKNTIQRKTDGEIFGIRMQRKLNPKIQQKMYEMNQYFEQLEIEKQFKNPVLDDMPIEEYEKFCERMKTCMLAETLKIKP